MQHAALVAGIGKDAQNEEPQGARLFVKHKGDAVAILNVGGMNHNAQQEAERVDENMPLAAGDVPTRIIALRVDRGPPLFAPLCRFGCR